MHHERRLHKLMLADELRLYERDAAASGALPTVPSVSDQLEDVSLEGGSDESLMVDNSHDPSQVRCADQRVRRRGSCIETCGTVVR